MSRLTGTARAQRAQGALEHSLCNPTFRRMLPVLTGRSSVMLRPSASWGSVSMKISTGVPSGSYAGTENEVARPL